MTNLTQASQQLFSRPADERFQSLSDLHHHCLELKNRSRRFLGDMRLWNGLVYVGHMCKI